MEVVSAIPSNSIPKVIGPTKDAFMKLLEKRRSEIESFPQHTFRFGSTDRHQLDVYYPDSTAISGGAVPVLFFFYGGGFVSGDRKQDPPYDLGYSNLGVFFAQRGILTVIPDYRLAPAVTFPKPVEDVRDAISWFLANTSTIAAAGRLGPDTTLNSVVVMSHSAGTNHTATLYLSPALLPLESSVRAATRGLILQGGAFKFDLTMADTPAAALRLYYGSDETSLENMPTALLDRASDELVQGLPEVYVMASEREARFINMSVNDFVEALGRRLGKAVKFEVMKGHNHISPHWALLSGEGEDWAEDVARWVKAKF